MKLFQQLRWKLTLSYTIVTVCAFMAVILILMGIILPRIFIPDRIISPERLVDGVRENSLPLLSHLLSQPEIDMKLLRILLQSPSVTVTDFELFRIGSLKFSAETTAALRGFIIRPDGILLGYTGHIDSPDLVVGKPFNPGIYEGLEAPLTAALSGEMNSKYLYNVSDTTGRYLMAIPVFNEDSSKTNQLVGAFVVIMEPIPTQADIPTHLLGIASRSLVVLLITFGFMGAIFGTFFANGLSTRFSRLTSTIDAWSVGDFSKAIIDSTGDEITQLSQRLNGMAKQLQELLRRKQEMAVAEERNRLARDLHDSAKQQALAASFQLGTALTLFESDPVKAKQHLIEADGLVDTVRNELTNLVYELRPHAVEIQDFRETLKEFLQDWSHRSSIETEVNFDGDDKTSTEIKETFLRIAQEALANIARHSAASKVDVSLEFGSKDVRMTIHDNGRGFDVNSPHKGLGLSSMRERTEAAGGSIMVISQVEQGTEIIVTLPNQ